MRKVGVRSGCLFLVTMLLATAGLAQDLPHTNPIVRGSNALAVELYSVFTENLENFVFSPSSVYTALAMLYGGARGETAAQIRNLLHLPEEMTDEDFHTSLLQLQAEIGSRANEGEVELGVANAIWPTSGYPILDTYLELIDSYRAEVETLDYGSDAVGAKDTINTWAAEKTNGRILNLLEDPPHPTTLLALANAIFFSGTWNAQFDPADTTQQPFHPENGLNSEVPLMNLETDLTYREFETVKVVELPYDGFRLSMVVVLPIGENTLDDVEDELSSQTLETWTTHYWRAVVNLFLPSFNLKSGFDLKPVLGDMGMTDVFVNRVADLSGIDGVPHWLSLGFMLQKASIEVHEKGAAAAAATVAGGCFPAGTEVRTSSGAVSIEDIRTGMTVTGFDFSKDEWIEATVTGTETTAYSGDVITVKTGGAKLTATGNHPFFVLSGLRLGSRPGAADAPPLAREIKSGGRWVEARDLREGDVLRAWTGEHIIASQITSRDDALTVYNLKVGGAHNYAVGGPGILVHNKGSAEPVYAEFRADRPFMFYIHDPATGAILFLGRVVSLP